MKQGNPFFERIGRLRFSTWFLWISVLGPGIYLLASVLNSHIGFPLDDSWIHQTYARNLAELGEFSFIPGQPSAGSTSPLWSAILAMGYLFRLPHLAWTYGLGWLSLVLVAYTGMIFSEQVFGVEPSHSRWVAVFLVLEWHLLWAAGSGMETLLFSGLVFYTLLLLFSLKERWFVVGALIGVSIWLRPDGLTLLGPLCWVIYFRKQTWRERFRNLVISLTGFLLLMGPYLVFNYMLAGNIWPNTFLAKQTEYAALQESAWIERFWGQIRLPLAGAGAILSPGIAIMLYRTAKTRSWEKFSTILWVVGFIGLYAWRLPVTYQHGRYIMPVMPVLFTWGLAGLLHFLKEYSSWRYFWVLSRTWILSLVFVQGLFLFLGARAYAQDVAWIETEMVQASRWIAENTQPSDLIAAHDIGALGYYSDREILDLAGLISPEVIPFMRNEDRLAEFLDQKQVKYLMTFPSWYPDLINGREMVYQTAGKSIFSVEPMTIYDWVP